MAGHRPPAPAPARACPRPPAPVCTCPCMAAKVSQVASRCAAAANGTTRELLDGAMRDDELQATACPHPRLPTHDGEGVAGRCTAAEDATREPLDQVTRDDESQAITRPHTMVKEPRVSTEDRTVHSAGVQVEDGQGARRRDPRGGVLTHSERAVVGQCAGGEGGRGPANEQATVARMRER